MKTKDEIVRFLLGRDYTPVQEIIEYVSSKNGMSFETVGRTLRKMANLRSGKEPLLLRRKFKHEGEKAYRVKYKLNVEDENQTKLL